MHTEVWNVWQAELDFQKEAANSVRCARELSSLAYLHVPEVLESLSSQVSGRCHL